MGPIRALGGSVGGQCGVVWGTPRVLPLGRVGTYPVWCSRKPRGTLWAQSGHSVRCPSGNPAYLGRVAVRVELKVDLLRHTLRAGGRNSAAVSRAHPHG